VLRKLAELYDFLQERWDSPLTIRRLGSGLVIIYISALILIELKRQGWLPGPFWTLIPENHLSAISLAFTLLLIFEAFSLTFSLAESVSRSVGKQFEILSLILLRDTFKEFTGLSEPLLWEEITHALTAIISSALAALFIFVVLGFYYRLLTHTATITDEQERSMFVVAKKMIALLIFISFLSICLVNLWNWFQGGHADSTFEAFYTLLIFCDVLLVLLALRYSSSYLVAFRNSGYAVATVLIRLALMAPILYGAMLGLGSAIFTLGLTIAYNHFVTDVTGRTEEG
jgi:hypothetical protein